MCIPGGWSSAEQCQKTLWWYNGSVDSGAMALPAMQDGDYTDVAALVGVPADTVRELSQYPLDGVPQRTKVGVVSEFPILYACGAKDGSDICGDNPNFNSESHALITSPYEYYRMENCGHDVLACGDATAISGLISKIIGNIESVY